MAIVTVTVLFFVNRRGGNDNGSDSSGDNGSDSGRGGSGSGSGGDNDIVTVVFCFINGSGDGGGGGGSGGVDTSDSCYRWLLFCCGYRCHCFHSLRCGIDRVWQGQKYYPLTGQPDVNTLSSVMGGLRLEGWTGRETKLLTRVTGGVTEARKCREWRGNSVLPRG